MEVYMWNFLSDPNPGASRVEIGVPFAPDREARFSFLKSMKTQKS